MRALEPIRRKRQLHIAIPASFVADIPQYRDKTAAVGLISRAAAIFRVDGVIVYNDPNGTEDDASFIQLILRYMNTPQYLRKKLFPLSPSLRYAGILHPLRTPNHPLKNKKEDLIVGDVRDGLVVRSTREYLDVDVGVKEFLRVEETRVPSKRDGDCESHGD